MNWDEVNWDSLERLRALFLESAPVSESYWKSEDDLASYDFTYAQRIAWKWVAVLRDLARLNWRPPSGSILDWGCGTGIASRCVVSHFGAGAFSALRVGDLSRLASRFAAKKAKARFPQLDVAEAGLPFPRSEPIGVLVLSHVLNEISPASEAELVELASRVESILWVEPGAHEVSRRLGEIRNRLLSQFRVVSPCTHQRACGMLTPENDRHWCHFFAEPPQEIFTDSHWSKFARRAGIDLRSLPYSYIVLDRRAAAPDSKPVESFVRIIGRPRVYKGFAKAFGCDASGVCERMAQKRDVPERFSEMKNEACDSLQRWVIEGGRVMRAENFG